MLSSAAPAGRRGHLRRPDDLAQGAGESTHHRRSSLVRDDRRGRRPGQRRRGLAGPVRLSRSARRGLAHAGHRPREPGTDRRARGDRARYLTGSADLDGRVAGDPAGFRLRPPGGRPGRRGRRADRAGLRLPGHRADERSPGTRRGVVPPDRPSGSGRRPALGRGRRPPPDRRAARRRQGRHRSGRAHGVARVPQTAPDGSFGGTISDPMALRWEGDRLVADPPAGISWDLSAG